MAVSSQLSKHGTLLLVLGFLLAVGGGLLNRKTRKFTTRVVTFGGGMLLNYFGERYLPQPAYNVARVVNDRINPYGTKGGKATKSKLSKSRKFKKHSS